MALESNAKAGVADCDRFRLRRFVDSLPPLELERRSARVDLVDVAAALDGNPRAVLFEKAGHEAAELVANVCASRSRIAIAFGVAPDRVAAEVMRRMRVPQDVSELQRDHAPVQEVVLEGPEADLTALPVHLQHALDGAPYISASVDFALDRNLGVTNVGMRRLMLRGRRKAGIDLIAPSDLRAIYEAQLGRGEPLPVAFAVGSHPIDHLAATLRIPGDELALMASLRGAALPVVKCITSDLRVPADAEYVIEGTIDARGYVEPEGPYGEFLGYYGEVKRNPVFHLAAITRRRDALFQSATIGGRSLARTDTAQLMSVRTEVTLWRALEAAVREVKAVHATPACGGAFNVRVAMRPRVPGEARNAIAAAFGSLVNVKNVFVVDPDVDVFSDEQMDWALATRFRADRDLVIASGFRAMPLDPSLGAELTWSKAGFDLTRDVPAPGQALALAQHVPEPPRAVGPRFDSIRAALAHGSKHFEELMAATGSRDGRELVRELEVLDARGEIARDADGRHRLAQ